MFSENFPHRYYTLSGYENQYELLIVWYMYFCAASNHFAQGRNIIHIISTVSCNFTKYKMITEMFYIFDQLFFKIFYYTRQGRTYWYILSQLVGMLLHISFNPFPHTTILQQTTLNIFCQTIENFFYWMDDPWLKVENIVAKGEIARIEQFLLLLLCFQKAVCCRGVRKRLYEGKG